MTLETRIIALAQAIGHDIKDLTAKQGDLTSLTTTAKSSLVAALNELKAAIDTLAAQPAGAQIDDGVTVTDKTWSSSHIQTQIASAISALVDSSPATLDTLNELAAALGNDPNFATTISTAIGNRIRYDDVQTLTAPQKLQACENIGVGNYDRDFVADYTIAKT